MLSPNYNSASFVLKARLKRKFRDKMFENAGKLSVFLCLFFVASILLSVINKGKSGFFSHTITAEVDLTSQTQDQLENLGSILKLSTKRIIQTYSPNLLPHVDEIAKKLLSKENRILLARHIAKNPSDVGRVVSLSLKLSSDVDLFLKHKTNSLKSLPTQQLLQQVLVITGKNQVIKKSFNVSFFTNSDSTIPESAGILGSLIGTMYIIIISLVVCCPVGILTSVFLEEYAKKNKLTTFLEITINNLASIPSIIYGLLGAALYINTMNLPRSSTLVGGLTLGLLVLPTMIIISRNSIRSVPKHVKDAAMAIGASRMQITLKHTIPIAMPSIITGIVLSIARIAGETAPLLIIGMVAFVANAPSSALDPATALPVQIFLWSDMPQLAFAEKTSAAILVLLMLLFAINYIAYIFYKKFQIKW